MVLFFHAAAIFTIDGQQPNDRMQGLPDGDTVAAAARQWIFFLTNGHAAVTFFFVHSGFVLTLALSRLSWSRPGVHYIGLLGNYYIKRVLRLWPIVIVGCLSLWGYHKLGFASSIDSVFSVPFRGAVALADQTRSLTDNILLKIDDLNPFQWSIAYEAVGSIFMPLLLLVARMPFKLYGLIVVFYLAVHIAISQPVIGLEKLPPNLTRADYLFCMMTGSFLFFSSARLRPIFSTHRRNILIACAIPALLLARWFILDIQLALLVEMIASSVIVYVVYYFDAGPLQTICQMPVMKFYGRISYSFYINSILSIRIAGPLVATILGANWVRGHGFAATLIAIGVALAINTPMSWLTHMLVEQPFTRLGRQIGSLARRRYAVTTREAEVVL